MAEINKVTRAQVGLVTKPGRYLLRFGWLTVTADDLWVWENYPSAAFTLVRMSAIPDEVDEFRLGLFELRTRSNYSESEK